MPNVRMSKREYDESHVIKRHTPTKAERQAVWDRMAKRYLKAKGYLGSKLPSNWEWSGGGYCGDVVAFTKSQVRAEVKKILGKKLPVDLVITKVQNVE